MLRCVIGSLLLGSLCLPGCKPLSALRQRCLADDVASCESACKKGIYGEDGCFHAGNLLRQRAALDFKSADYHKALDYFARSCDGGYADGCLFSGELIGAPHTPDPSSDLPKPISDAEIRNREKRFRLACSHGSSSGCKRLGDVLIGKNADAAEKAYSKACDTSTASADCKKARASEVAQADRWRTACKRGVADDCTKLGDLLYQVDPPRAVRLFAAECQLRGVAALSSGVDHFVRERIEQARFGAELPAPPAASSASPLHTFDVVSPVVNGPIAVVEVLQAFSSHTEALSRCMDLGGARVPAELHVELVVDLTGDTYRASVTGPAVPSEVGRCIESVAEAFAFTPPTTLATVDVTLRVRGPEVSGQAASGHRK